MIDSPPPRSSSWATADHIGGLIWLVFGAAVFYGSWTMDRLENQNINPVTAPGLVPGLISVGIIAFALVLLLRRGKPQVVGGHAEDASEAPTNWRRLIVSWVLCVGFAGLLLGRGIAFWLLAGAFVFLHILFLDDPDRIAEQPLAKRALLAAVIAVCTSAAVTLVFQKIFLVRLP
jgi:putative tricarboxylic transport membrane protein